ncbi:membrane-associated protein, putative, partial [Bodo saltans]
IETRLAVVEFFTYTPALNLFSSFKSFTEVTIGGRIETYVQSQNFKLWTPHLAGYTVFFVIFMISVLLYSFALVRNVRRAARVGALWSQCLFSGWFFLDVANVLIFYAAFVVHIVWIAQSVSTNVQVWYPTLEQRDAYPQELEFVLFLYQMEQYFNATNTVLCFLKLIKFTSLHSDVSAVIGTLQRAKDTMLSVLIIFLLVVLAYAVAGTIVFGTFLPDDYSTVTKSFSSLLRLLVGDFDYESMRLVNGAIAGLFFWSFVILALFLMLSFIVGLLASEFGEERERIDESKKRTLQQEEHDKRLREEAGDAHHRPPSLSTRFKLWCKALRAAPKDTIQERFDVILLWMRAPRYMRRLERALVEYTAAEASKFTAATAGLDARVVAKKRKQLRRHRVTAERMIDIVTEYRKKPIPRSLVANFWTRATAEMSYDKEVCDDNADDVALQSMKDAVDHVLTDLFGLVAVGSRDGTLANAELEHYRSSKTLWNSIQDTAAAAPGGASTAADDTQAERTADGNGTSATEGEGAQRRQQYSLNSTAAAHEALQVRDALLHEEQLQTQLRALDTMVSRLELCVLEAVIAVNLGPDALRQSNVPSPPTGRREPSEGHHAPF